MSIDRPSLELVAPMRTAEAVGLSPTELSDDELMERAAAGRQDAFAHLVQRYMPQLLRYCCKQAGDARRGEELAQETWLRVWGYRNRYRSEGKFRVLLYTAARNRCRTLARDAGRRARWVSDQPVSAQEREAEQASQLEAVLAQEQAGHVQAALLALKPKLREALLLRFDQDLEYSEIAAIVGRSESTVRSRIFHGLKKLRVVMQGESS